MLTRLTALPCPALLVVLACTFIGAGEARAHRLDAARTIYPGRMVQVESWFPDDTRPWGAKVEVFREDGQLFVEGRLNKEGLFVFFAEKPEPLRVLITTSDGHTAELSITAKELASKAEGGPVPVVERDTGVPLKELMAGIALVLAAAAFVLSLRNARRLNNLKKSNDSSSPIRPT